MTKYEEHIEELCRNHKITIKRSANNAANMLSKIVWINPKIRSIKTYFGALHEIGHVMNEYPLICFNMNRILWNQNRAKSCAFVSKYIIQSEIDAWKQAFDVAKWTNATADKLAVMCLFTYIYGYNLSHKKPYKDIDNEFMSYVRTEHINDVVMMTGLKNLLFK